MSAPALTRLFEIVSLQHESYRQLSGDDWSRYRAIRAHYESERTVLNDSYRREYDTRVETARADLLSRATAKRWDHRPPLTSHSRLNTRAIERQAHRQVRDAHNADLTNLETRECDHIRALIDDAHLRERKPAESEARHQQIQPEKQTVPITPPTRIRPR